jgi:NADH-quinone oxidoreductase subunit E
MLWLTWHMWILILLAFAGGVIVGWVLHDQSDEVEQNSNNSVPTPPSAEIDAEPVKSAPDESQVETILETRQNHPVDDLTQINGLGSKMAERLNEQGVVSLSQIASWTDSDVENFDQLTNARGRIDRENWVAQAKVLTTK